MPCKQKNEVCLNAAFLALFRSVNRKMNWLRLIVKRMLASFLEERKLCLTQFQWRSLPIIIISITYWIGKKEERKMVTILRGFFRSVCTLAYILFQISVTYFRFCGNRYNSCVSVENKGIVIDDKADLSDFQANAPWVVS